MFILTYLFIFLYETLNGVRVLPILAQCFHIFLKQLQTFGFPINLRFIKSNIVQKRVKFLLVLTLVEYWFMLLIKYIYIYIYTYIYMSI